MNKQYLFLKYTQLKSFINRPKIRVSTTIASLVVLVIIVLTYVIADFKNAPIPVKNLSQKSNSKTIIAASPSATTQQNLASINNNSDLKKVSSDISNTDLNQIDNEVKKLDVIGQ